ncbi:MAG: NTP transferase domain-containing protein [Eubacteriales bacterium]|jgi:bifunctional UDP-N-acetylglucosamine pyrophosphorylase/glucosamine-1-phosphate N-acetyltransferase|nr:NTP transferase domain-containing protein [Clostridiales bacterium]
MKAIIMAAGKGTRLASLGGDLPKVLRMAGGKPLLAHVLETASCCKKEDIVIVTGYLAEKVEESFPDYTFVRQGEDAYGTGYAVMCGMSHPMFEGYDGEVLILNGDMPLVRRETVVRMLERHRSSGCACTLLSCVSRRELPFGRVIRDKLKPEPGNVVAIVEDADCTPQQKLVRELNVGTYIFDATKLRYALANIKNDNPKREYYLTDTVSVLISAGERVDAYITPDETEMWGVNTPEDLQEISAILNSRSK